MKKEFTTTYVQTTGIFSKQTLNMLMSLNKETINVEDIFQASPINDFLLFILEKGDLSIDERRYFYFYCAKYAVSLYENRYPKDFRVRECVNSVDDYMAGKIGVELLKEKLIGCYEAMCDATSERHVNKHISLDYSFIGLSIYICACNFTQVYPPGIDEFYSTYSPYTVSRINASNNEEGYKSYVSEWLKNMVKSNG